MEEWVSVEILPEDTDVVILVVRVPGGGLERRFGWYEHSFQRWYMCRKEDQEVHPVMYRKAPKIPKDASIREKWIEQDSKQHKSA